MSDRNKPHFGRRLNGARRVRLDDVEDKLADPNGAAYIQDEVRLGGAVADVGAEASQHANELQRMIDDNREGVERLRHPEPPPTRHP